MIGKLLRLKKDARQYFKGSLHDKTKPFSFWENESVVANALEEVPEIEIRYGIKHNDSLTTKCGWSSIGDVTHFDFSIYFNGVDKKIYDQMKIEDNMVSFVEHIERAALNYYKDNYYKD